jgi:signal transduction histidine kinase/ActR/RegA family two-component response regulator
MSTTAERHEAALLKTGALQDAIFNSANFSSIATDEAGVIQLFNVGAERMLGYAAADVVDRVTPADISDPAEIIARARALSDELGQTITPGFEALVFKASRGIEDIYELTYIRKDGTRLPAVVSVTALRDAHGAIIGYLLIGTDNTAREQVEAERQRLDQRLREQNVELQAAKAVAEKANLAKSEFLSSMSHELRTPLTAILGFAELMESDSPTPTQKESLAQILKGGWYLLELINEVLDLSVIESGQLSMSLEPVALADVVPECRTMIESQAQKLGVVLRFPEFDDPCFVMGDRTRIKQIIVNLLTNAVKYNEPGGLVEVAITCTPERVRVSVSDTGVGLSAEKLGQLFIPFNRLGQERSTTEGTGIGLVVTKRLIELMGGEIGVTSEEGVGSVFWVEMLPSAPPVAEGVVPDSAHQPTPHSDTTVLYVEDNPANMKLVELLIARRPRTELLMAGTASAGIEIARTRQPTLILMDVNLPDMSGIEALRILQDDRATSHIPVLALTANAMPRDVKHGLKAGFFRYLTKPIKVDQFMAALDDAIEAAAAESAAVAG